MKRKISKPFPNACRDFSGRYDKDGVEIIRWRYRVKGKKTVTLKGPYGSPEFAASYRAAVEGLSAPQKKATPDKATKGGATVKTLIELYQRSVAYHKQTQGSRNSVDLSHRRIAEFFKDLPVKTMNREDVKDFLSEFAHIPQAGSKIQTDLKVLMDVAIDKRIRESNPVVGIKLFDRAEEGRPWTAEERAQFEAYYPIGTMPRLCYSLCLFTGQRLSDVVHLGPRSIVIRNGRRYFAITQKKTKAYLELWIRPELEEVLAAHEPHGLIFLQACHQDTALRPSGRLRTNQPRPFKDEKSLSNYMLDRRVEAGLTAKGCVTHGLRHSALTDLAEAGATPHEIMAVGGHTNLASVIRYTRNVGQRKMADSAMDKVTTHNNLFVLPIPKKEQNSQ